MWIINNDQVSNTIITSRASVTIFFTVTFTVTISYVTVTVTLYSYNTFYNLGLRKFPNFLNIRISS